MNGRLDQICLMPPAADTPWTGPPAESERCEIKRIDGQIVSIDVPLFWFDPPWHEVQADAADVIASGVAESGITISALRSDLSGPDGEPDLHATESDEAEADGDSDDAAGDFEPLSRIVPYRPERYGLNVRDFDGARFIDVRLAANRDATGRFAYSAEQVERWESTPANEPLAGGSWVPSASFPPDVASIERLSSKLNQLRSLSPTAAVFVSIGPYRLHDELPKIIANRPDGVILRLDELPLDGLQLVLAVRTARRLMDQAGAEELPLWIVPGDVTPDDAVKLVACGASAVAVDHWCNELIEAVAEDGQQSSGYGVPRVNPAFVQEWIEDNLSDQIDRFCGLSHALRTTPREQSLGSLDPAWADALGITKVSLTG